MNSRNTDARDPNADDSSADLEETHNLFLDETQDLPLEDTQSRRGLSVEARTIAGGYNPYDTLPFGKCADQGNDKRKKPIDSCKLELKRKKS
jgi:hypothetical protein